MTDKNMNKINDEELDLVVGGNELGASVKVNGATFTGRVDMYAGQLYTEYYIVDDDKDEWFYGTLYDSFEAEFTFHTIRTHVFRMISHNGEPMGGVREFCGDDYTLYTTKQ